MNSINTFPWTVLTGSPNTVCNFYENWAKDHQQQCERDSEKKIVTAWLPIALPTLDSLTGTVISLLESPLSLVATPQYRNAELMQLQGQLVGYRAVQSVTLQRSQLCN